ncbi:J domain-containing protein [Shinella sp. DD12]|uniref:J domain-containing protein n=1 Tax=Shinella sp. DD12 TaxID=1410620 RepID=UPI0003C52EFB|nr:J domain-containing protein [Shinella sp. DD12]EYR79997.1 DnaJ-class molecular chaperone [Shinella sp. DD12]
MAKKANGAGSAFIFIAMVAIFILIAAVNIGILLYPFIVGAAYAYGKFAPKQPDIPDPSDYDNALDRLAILAILKDRDQKVAYRDTLHSRAELENLRATKGSGYSRYDTRRAIASEINKELDFVEQELSDSEQRIYDIRYNRFGMFPDWKKLSHQWIRRKSIGYAAEISLKYFAIILSSLFILKKYAPSWYEAIATPFAYISRYVIFHDDYPFLAAFLVAAGIAGYSAFALGYLHGQRKFLSMIDHALVTRWLSMEENWHPASSYDCFQVYRDPVIEDADDGRFLAADSSTGEHWTDVLGVASDATPDEVKAAYRAIIKSYHSDRVVGLGPKLQAVAEDETKRINLAYEQAKAAKGI